MVNKVQAISKPTPILSPCTGICALDANGLCEGCFRDGDEISRWSAMSAAERAHLMHTVLPERERIFGS
jgi:uncharacterized protein